MKICNIYPIKNQFMYKSEKTAMILAQYVKKGLYKKSNFTNCDYIIMDNGLFEGEQVSTNLQDLIDIAVKSKIEVKEIVLPDVMLDPHRTYKLFKENLFTMCANPNYRYMYVCHGNDPREVAFQINIMNDFVYFFNSAMNESVQISLGIPKNLDFNRDHPVLIEAYKKSCLPIHFLGLKSSFCELEKVKNIIRSCDSSQLSFLILNDKESIEEYNTIYLLHRDLENDRPINLSKDKINYNSLIKGKEKLDEELERHLS